MRRKTVSILAISLGLMSLCSTMISAQTTIHRMTKEELKSRLNDPQTDVV